MISVDSNEDKVFDKHLHENVYFGFFSIAFLIITTVRFVKIM